MSLVQLFLHEINKLRTNPQSYVEKFEKICNELSTVKRKKALYEELLGFTQKLKKAPAVPPLRLSEAFSNVANLRIRSIISNKGFSNDDFMEIAQKHAKGFDEIFQIYDHFNDNPATFLVEQLMDPKDDLKTNRTVLFDPNLQYLGINDLDEGRKNDIILLVFADDCDVETVISKNTFEQILDCVNITRLDPKSAAKNFENILVEARKRKMSQKYLDSLQELLDHCYNSTALAPLRQNDYLNSLADSFSKNPANITKRKDFEEIAKTKISNINLLFGVYNIGNDNAEDIVQKCLTSENENISLASKNGLLGRNIKEIGIAYNEKSKTAIIVTADKFDEGPEEPFDESFLNAFNSVRCNPKPYSSDLLKKTGAKKWLSAKYTKALKYLANEIGKRKGLKEVTIHQALVDACNELLDHAESKKGFYKEEEDILKLRLSHFCSGYKIALEILDQSNNKPEDVLVNMLIHDKVGADNLNIVFNEKIKYIGIASRKIQGKNSTVIIVLDEVRELVEKTFEEEFIDEVNHLRVYPKSYIKVFQGIHENPTVDKINDNKVRVKDEALMFTQFLKNVRSYGIFNSNEYLTKAAEARLASFQNNKNTVTETSHEELKKLLSTHCSQVNIFSILASSGFETARNFLCSSLLNIHDNEKLAKNIIFNQKYYCYGLAYDSDNQIVVVIFADQANSPKLNDEPVVSRNWNKLNRPNLSKDEKEQLARDFQLLDTNNIGYVFPNTIITFMDMLEGFKEDNIIYYEAFQSLNTVENNKKGVNYYNFEEAVQKVIKLQTRENWERQYDFLVKNSGSSILTHKVLWRIMKSLNYDYTEQELKEIVFKISHDGYDVDTKKGGGENIDENVGLTKEKFMSIILAIESNWQARQAR